MYEVEDIVTLIEQAGAGTAAIDIFAYSAPADAKACIIVYPSNDPPAINPETPFYMKGRFQVIIRHYDYATGMELSKTISNALTFYNTETTLMTIKECRPLYQVRVYRRSGSGEIEFSVTYQITYVQK
jgi:hypothetical protein